MTSTTISTHFKHLYIIGNGFDIHHSINSSYSNYRNWLEENEPDIYSQLCDLYGVSTDEDEAHEWWSDFENMLSEIDLYDYHLLYLLFVKVACIVIIIDYCAGYGCA